MPFDQEKWHAVARQGQAAGPHLKLALTITQVVHALEKIEAKTGIDLSDERRELLDLNRSSFETFVQLTGWTSEDGR